MSHSFRDNISFIKNIYLQILSSMPRFTWLILLFFSLTASSQPDYPLGYSPRIIKDFGIRAIYAWSFEKPEADSSIENIWRFGKAGNLMESSQGEHERYGRYVYEYDSFSRPTLVYKVSSKGYIWFVEENIYSGVNLNEERNYKFDREPHIDSLEEFPDSRYSAYFYRHDSMNRIIQESYCFVNYPPKTDSLIEIVDVERGYTVWRTVPRQQIVRDTLECIRTIDYSYDSLGRLVRQKTQPYSNIYIDDSFAYDTQGNMIYKVTFNSGKVSRGNSREKKPGDHRETFYMHTYDSLDRLRETRTWFDRYRICCLRTTFEYFPGGVLQRKTIFKTYPKDCRCYALLSGGDIYGLGYRFIVNNRDEISDTLFQYIYDRFGQLTEEREYCGVAQKGEQGELYYLKQYPTDSLGILLSNTVWHGSSHDLGSGLTEPWSYGYFYVKNSLGLIGEVRKEDGKLATRYYYEFW